MAYPFGNASRHNPKTSTLNAGVRRGLLRRRRRSSGLLPNSPDAAAPRRTLHQGVSFEALEPRLLLSADIVPFHVDMADTGIGDDITLRLDADTNTLEIYQNANPALGPVVSQKLDETSEIIIEGVDDRDDTLTVDFSDPFFVDISFDGGAGGIDSLNIEGGEFDSAEYTATSPDSGTIEYRDGEKIATIDYFGLEPIVNSGTATDVVFNFDFNTNPQLIEILTDPGDSDMTLIRPFGNPAMSDPEWFEEVSFDHTAVTSLAVNAGDGNDRIILHPLVGTMAVTLDGGDGTDAIEVSRDADFTLADGSIDIGAQSAVLVDIEDADLSVETATTGQTFDITGWSRNASLTGGTGTDTVEAAGSGDLSLSDTGLNIGTTQSVSLSGIDEADLTGDDAANEFSVAGWTGTATLSGLGGDDTYDLGDLTSTDFGDTTIVEATAAGNDIVDVVHAAGALTVSTTSVTDDTISDGISTVTQGGAEFTERIDATIVPAAFNTALADLESFVNDLQAAGGDLQALTNQLPLLDRLVDGGIADVVQLTDSIAEFVSEANTSQATFAALVAEINTLLLDAGAATDTLTVTATNQGYQANADGDLALLLGLSLDADRNDDDIALDFGIDAGNRGIGVEGSLSIQATLDVDVTLGFTNDLTDQPYLLDTGSIDLVLNEARATLDSINLGFLSLDVVSGDAVLDGRIDISFVGPGPINLDADPLSVTSLDINPLGADYFESNVGVEAPPGVDLGDGLLSAAGFSLSLPAGQNPFGDDQTGAIEPVIDISATGANGRDIDLTDFANISASEIIGMLGEIADLLSKIAGSQFLEIGIPFTELDVGHILNLGGTYKETVLDPLFVSGDALRPDNNEDGQIDSRDLTFASIQELVERLENVLDPNNTGLALTAEFDFGRHVSTPVADPDEPDVTTQTITVHNAQDGSYILSLFGAASQPILWNAPATRAEDDTESMQAKLDQLLADAGSAIRVNNVVLEVQEDGDRVYEIEFTENPVELLTLDSDSLVEVADPHSELTFRIEYDTSFGFGSVRIATDQEGGDGLDEVQTIEINAVESSELDDTFTLSIRGSPDGAPFVTEAIAWNADAGAINDAIERLGVTVVGVNGTAEQELRLRNTAGNGSFTLTDGTDTTVEIAFSDSADDIATALTNAGFSVDSVQETTVAGSSERVFRIQFLVDPGQTLDANGFIGGNAVTVEVTKDAGEDFFEVTFTGDFGSTNVPTLTADASELMGAFGFDLGASLGDLASITSSGSFSPLVNLNAGLTFGLNLSPSEQLTIVPPAFAPTPRVTVVTTQDGGAGAQEQQIVSVQSANDGTFALRLGDETVDNIAFDITQDDLRTELNNALTGVTIDTVDLDDTKEGIRSYTITFVDSDGDVREFQGISTGLMGIADNGQLVADAEFTVTLFNGAYELAGAGTVRPVDERLIDTITILVPQSATATNSSLDDLREDVQRAVNAQIAAMGFSLGFLNADNELSTGALGAAQSATGNAGAPLDRLFNDLDFTLLFEQQVASGQATAPTADDDPLTTLRHGDPTFTFTSSVKVGDIVVRGSETAVVQSVNDDTVVHTAFSTGWAADDDYEIRRPTEISSQLRAVDILDALASGSVTQPDPNVQQHVVSIDNAGGGYYRLTVNGTNVWEEVATDVDVSDRTIQNVTINNAVQKVTIENALGGTFTLTLDGSETDAIAFDATANGTGSVAEALAAKNIDFESVGQMQTDNGVIFTILFASDPGADLEIDDTGLEGGIRFDAPAENIAATEVNGANPLKQVVTISKATSGTFTLELNGITTDPIDHDAAATGTGSISEKLAAAGIEFESVTRSQTENDVTFIINFASDPNDTLVADGALLGSGSIEELLLAAGLTGVTVSADPNDVTTDNSRRFMLNGASTVEIDDAGLEADGLLLNEDGSLRDDEAGRTGLTADDYVAALQAAIDNVLEQLRKEAEANAFEGTEFGDFAVTVDVDGGNLRLTVDTLEIDGSSDNHTLELSFRGPVQVDAGGGRLALSTSPVLYSTSSFESGTRIDRRLQVEITDGFDDAAYQQLGLLSAPTSFSGVITDNIELQLIVDGDTVNPVTLFLAAGNYNDMDGLVLALQGALSGASASLITVERIKAEGESESTGNRIQFKAASGVESIQVIVPATSLNAGASVEVSGTTDNQLVTLTNAVSGTFKLTDGINTTTAIAFDASADVGNDSVLARLTEAGFAVESVSGGDGGPYTITFTVGNEPGGLLTADIDNGAITELGFDAGEGEEKRGKATEFFIDDVGFTGDFRLVAENLSATASLGFLGIKATGSGTIGDATAEVSGTTVNQTVLLTNADGGSFTLSDGDRTTTAIAHDAAATGGADSVQGKLEAAGFAGVTVTGGAGGPFTITFASGSEPDDLLEADDDKLTTSGLDDKLLEGGFSIELRNPTDGKDRLTPGDIVGAFENGDFFFDAEELADTSKTGILDGALSGEFGAEFGIAPDGFLSGLSDDLNAGFEVGLASPNWLDARPALSDELGFGDTTDRNGNDVEGPINFTGAGNLFTLGKATQENGQLAKNLAFLVSNDGGVTEALGFLNVSDTKPAVEINTTTQGSGTQGEVQVVTVRNASDGTFTLTLGDQVTRKILYNAPDTGAGSVQSALEALSGVAIASVTKSGSGGEIKYTITFDQSMANVDELTGNPADLSRGRAELRADLQKAVNLALGELGDNLGDKISVSIDSDGKVQLEGDAGFRIRLNSVDVQFTGSDFDDLLDRFSNISFEDIIFALKKAVEFLQTLDGSDGGDAKIPALTVDFPLIERSISDLLDPASDFLDFVDEINSDPAGSLQKLNIILANVLGFDAAGINTDVSGLFQTVSISDATAGTFTLAFGGGDDATSTAPIQLDFSLSPVDLAQSVFDALTAAGADVSSVTEVPDSRDETNGRVGFDIEFATDPGFELVGDAARLGLDILSLNPLDTSEILIDLKFAAGAQLSRPFSLDLADAFAAIEAPDFIADFVGVDASGTLSLDAGVELGLSFGIDISGDDKGIFLRIDDTRIEAHANASAGDLDFSAKLGPFGVFVVDGEAGLGGSIGFGLVNTDGDNRFDLVRFGSAVSVEAVTKGDTSVQLITVRSAGAGTFTLGDGANVTGAIDWNASADGVFAELSANGFDVQSVTGGDGGPYTVTFNNPPAGLLEADGDDISRSDIARIADFLSLELNPASGGGIQVDATGAAVLPLFIGTEGNRIPIDQFDGDGMPGDDNFVVATFDALEVFDDDPQGQEDDGISVDFATVSRFLAHDISTADLETVIGLLGVTDDDGNAVAVVGDIAERIDGNDRIFTVTFGGDAQRLLAASTSLIVGVDLVGPASAPGTVQEIRIKDVDDAQSDDTFRLASPSAVGVNFFNDLELPGLFALLSDPAVVVDGLDRVLQTVQDALNGQVFGVDLPFVGDLLADNPAANIIGDFRNDLLKPLSNTIRENNLNLDGLIGLLKETLFDVLGPDGINLLKDRPDDVVITDDGDDSDEITIDDIRVLFLNSEGEISDVFSATSLQFDFDLGQDFQTELADIEFDLGIDALGIEVELAPQLEMDWNLHVGFGVDQSSGFYFVSRIQDEDADGNLVTRLEDPTDPASGAKKELDLNLEINFGEDNDTRVNGRLIFLALGLIDGIDTDGDGIRDEFTKLFLDGGIDLMDPDDDGRLTFSEMTSASLSDVFEVGINGGAQLRIDAMVDFSTIHESLGNVLPQIGTDIVADFAIEAQVGQGLTVHAPEVAFLDVTLDLGSFISDFAGPILEAVADVLGPLDFLIGPDGFLNKRIPLLSDLLGRTITGKDLVALYDPVRGPQVVAFLDFVDDLYFLATLVTDAAEEAEGGDININFGDLVLFDNPDIGLDLSEGGRYVDQLFDIGLAGGTDLRDLDDLDSGKAPEQKDIPPTSKPQGSKTKSFTKGVTESGSIMFPILQPENVFKLLMGQTTTLVQIELPEFGFDFFYRQIIPIYGPIVGTVAGGISSTIDMGFGYDTLGLEQFLVTQNPANLINGFFLSDTDPATGEDRVEVSLQLEIAVGAGLSAGFITAGVEGGFAADIDFNLSDLNNDTKVRFDEMLANVFANSFIPLAIFDVSGMFELFLRAFYEINLGLFSIDGEFEFVRLKLFEFNIPFTRPSILAVQNGDTLTLNVGSNAEGRLNGDLRDIAETIHVKTKSDGSVVVWSDQFNVNEVIAGINPFVGVKRIEFDAGAGNDFIDLSGVNDASITIDGSGGDGNDTIIGGIGAKNILRGGGGRDELTGGDLADELYGDDGNDTLKGLGNLAVPIVRVDRVPGTTNQQRITFDPGITGRYTLIVDGVETDEIATGASADDILQALRGAGIFEADDNGDFDPADTVTGASGDYLVSFATAPLRPMQAVSVGVDKLFGGDGNDTLDGGAGADLLDGGLGDDLLQGGGGHDVMALANFGSTDIIDGSSGPITLDFSGKSENLAIFVQDGAILVGFGDQLIETAAILTSDISTGTDYFSSQLIVTNPTAVEQIIGGDFDDTYYVQGTASAGAVTLDGGKGNDQYLLFSGTDTISVHIDDRGNPWNSGDLIDVIGTTGDDDIVVTASQITIGAGQTATYVPPPLDSNVLAIRVRGDNHDPALAGDEGTGGDDTITIASTDVAVPVRVETGRGNDTVIVGDGTVDNIAGVLRPGVNSPFGLGPLVLVGDAGHDVVIVDDSADTSNNFGNSSAVLENRQSEDDPVEIGVVSGLDMILLQDEVQRDGRIEFEGFEVIDVRLGTGNDFFTLGGDFNLELAADDPARGKSEARQLVDTEFSRVRLAEDTDSDGIFAAVHSITGMTFVSGGDEAVTPAMDEVQEIVVNATFGVFTLTFEDPEGNPRTTDPIPYNASAEFIRQALIALSNIGENDVVVEVAEDDVDQPRFVVQFRQGLGGRDVAELVANTDDLTGSVTITSFDGVPTIGGGDVINVIATQDLDSDEFDRNNLNDLIGVLSTSTVDDGDPGPDDTVIGDGVNERQRLTIADAAVRASAAFGASVGYFTLQFDFEETRPIAFDADADDIRDALAALSLIGDNVVVTDVSGPSGNRVLEIEFVLDKAELDQGQITAKVVPLMLLGGAGIDQINVESVDQTTFLLGGSDDDRMYVNVDVSSVSVLTPELPDPPLANTMNGVNATVTLDGSEGSDFFDINTIGGTTDSLINVFDTGSVGFDRLTVFGIDNPDLDDLFLIRAGDKENSLAFIALLNSDDTKSDDEQPFERINYNAKLEQIVVEGLAGDDQFYIDDTRAAITINGGLGDDFFQIGQLYKTARTVAEAGVAPEDVFATVETTRGFLSNGISDPMTINGGKGEDEFIVFRNLAVLTLNGGDNNDTFLVQAFALVGSVEDERARTDITGDGGADQIQYAVNAPVQINGGDGLDTVIVIGTEFNDDFVVTDQGVFGGGLNVNFINIELLEVDGAEGDDRFFILSTGENFVTKLVGSKGNDTFNVNGPTPENGVISNDLLGHSGIIEHLVASNLGDSIFEALEVDGISANVADNDEPAIIVTPSDRSSSAYAGSFDDYTVVLSRPPRTGTVRITVVPPKGLVLFRQDPEDPTSMVEVRNQSGDAIGFDLLFDATNWFIPQTVGFALDQRVLDEPGFSLPTLADIEHTVSAEDTITGTVSSLSANGDFIPEEPGLPVKEEAKLVSTLPKFPPAGPGLPESLRGAFVVAGGQTRLILDVLDETTLILDRAWDEIPVGETFQILGYSGVQVPNVRVAVHDPDVPGLIVEELGDVAAQPGAGTDSSALTTVAENGGDDGVDFIRVRLASALQPGESVTVDLKSSVVGGTDVGFDGQLRFFNAAGDEITSLTFDDANPYDQFQLVRVVAFDDAVVEGFHNVDLKLEASGSGYDGVESLLVVAVADDDAPGVRIVQSGDSTDVIEFNADLIAPIPVTAFEDSQTQTGNVFSPNVLTFNVDLGGITIDGDALLTISAIADLNWIGETLLLDAEGIVTETLFAEGGTEYGVSTTTVAITEQQLQDLVAGDGTVTLTITPSAEVDDFSGFYGIANELTVNLAVFSELEGSIGLALSEGFPAHDTYEVSLTAAPQPGETVTVTVDPRETRTSRTGGIVTFADQVEVSLDGINFSSSVDLTFTDADWNVTQTVFVRALDDLKVDGGDTKVFAPMLDQVNRIQGPLFIVGGEGTDRTGLLEREPVMLPGEINQKASLGPVVTATEATEDEAATVTIAPTQALLDELGVGSVSEITPEMLIDKTIEIVSGPAKNKVRIVTDAAILSDDEILLTLNKQWDSQFSGDTSLPTSASAYTIMETNPNFLVDETEQVDYLVVDDTDNINSFDDPALPPGTSNPFAEGALFFETRDIYGSQGNPEALNRHRITGFGMGGDRVIGGNTEDAFLQPGGITYEELEVVEINLGDGNNRLTVDNSIARADGFRTWTLINTGGGDDVVIVNLNASEDGRIAIDLDGGNDIVDASGTVTNLPLVVFGGLGDDRITGGAGDDIIFGDRGQVDFLDEDGAIVTRLGRTPDQVVGAPTEASTGANLVDANADFPLADPAGTVNGSLAGLYVTITVGPGVGQQRLITGNSETELFLDSPWDVDEATGLLPDETSRYLILTTPEFQTDSVDRDPTFLRSIDPGEGGADTIDAGDGENVVFGGIGSDGIAAGDGSDVILGDNGRFTLGRTDLFEEGEETSTLSINFIGSDRRTGPIDGAAGAPGARAENWNNIRFDAPDFFGSRAGEILFFDDGSIAPGITVEWARNPDSALPGSPRLGMHEQIDANGDPDLALFHSYLDVNENDVVGINVEGLGSHFQTYDLYVYLDAGDRDSEAGESVRSISDGTTQYFLDDADGNTFAGTYVEVTSTDAQAAGTGNYVVFRGLSGDRAEIRVSSLGGSDNERNNLPIINGLQVVGRHNPIDQLESVAVDIGGADIIRSGGGGDIVFGGTGNDDIESYGSGTRGADDADVVAGDNALARFMLGDLRSVQSMAAAPGGDDRIVTGNGEDLVIGGSGDDMIDTGIVEETRDAQIISFNFGSSTPKGAVTGLAGAAQAGNWNNLNGGRHLTFGDEPDEAILFNDGSAANGVTIEWGNARQDGRLGKNLHQGSHDEIPDPDTHNERLFEGYISASRGEVLAVDIRGLNNHYAVYDLYVYLDLSDSDGGDVSVHDISDGTTTYYLNDAAGNTYEGEFVLADSTDPDAPATGNYVVFRNLTSDAATIRIGAGDGVHLQDRARLAGISGLQVVGGAMRDQAVVPGLGIVGGDFDRDNVVGDEATARLFNGTLYELATNEPSRAGNDTIFGGEGGDTLIGGSGDDYLGGQSGHDLLIGDNAHLTFFTGVLLGLDRDNLPIQRIEDQGRHGDEQYGISGNRLTDIGIGGDDILEGGSDDDLMFGQAGSDTYRFAGGGLGEDTAIEAGNDARTGAPNDDHDVLDFSDFIGGIRLDLSKDDRSFVNTRRLDGDVNLTLTIGASSGFEDVIGSGHDDIIFGNIRSNVIVGGGGNDVIYGGDGDDLLFGEDDDDVILGGRGADVIDGGPGNDTLIGGADPDLLMGRGGDDVLDGGAALDNLDGGPGDDRFKGVKRDRVVDPDDKSIPADQDPGGSERVELPLISPADLTVLVNGDGGDVMSNEPEAGEAFAGDDLVALTIGANLLASAGLGTEIAVEQKRRPYSAEISGSARRAQAMGPLEPTLVFDEALGAWISSTEAGLLRLIDGGQIGQVAPGTDLAGAEDNKVRIDWSAQAGVSGLISRNPLERLIGT